MMMMMHDGVKSRSQEQKTCLSNWVYRLLAMTLQCACGLHCVGKVTIPYSYYKFVFVASTKEVMFYLAFVCLSVSNLM